MCTPVVEDRSKPAPKKDDVQAKAVAAGAAFGTIIVALMIFIGDKAFDRINVNAAALAEQKIKTAALTADLATLQREMATRTAERAELQIKTATLAAELAELRRFAQSIESYITSKQKDQPLIWPSGP